ncbi:hypothetical protein [Kitasatospora sp. A2-31]|uniref:hypothetical protein n=1 Tax=Kitasatospora sp. A2-31 TaxID=2916414 RepID=UPI001EED25C0|nr:hypothetical protein [Kitasatospora sp. A2-31]MCG6498831.1 hypothetical protein [Kitasatospora sp. A2-31]
MPDKHSRKKAVRERMAATGETYRQAVAALDQRRWAEWSAQAIEPSHDDGSGWGTCTVPDCPECAEGRRRGEEQRVAHQAMLDAPQCPGPERCVLPDCPEGCNEEEELDFSMCRDCWAVDLSADGANCPSSDAPR